MPEREVKPFLKKASADVPSRPLAARRGTQGLPSHKKEGIDDDLVGGVSMLSGYLNKVRAAGSADQRKNLPARAGKFRLRHRGGVPPAAQSLDESCRGQAGGPEWAEWIPE